MDLKQLFLTRSHDGYLGKEDKVSISKCKKILFLLYSLSCVLLLLFTIYLSVK